jgi:hypothetical protein
MYLILVHLTKFVTEIYRQVVQYRAKSESHFQNDLYI